MTENTAFEIKAYFKKSNCFENALKSVILLDIVTIT